MPLPHDLMDLDRQLDREATILAARYQREVQKQLATFRARLQKELAGLPTTKTGKLARRSPRFTESRLRVEMAKVGRVSDAGIARVSKLTRFGTQGLRAAGIIRRITPTQTRALVQLVTRRQAEIRGKFDGLMGKIGATIQRGTQGGMLASELLVEVDEIARELDNYPRQWFKQAGFEYVQGIAATAPAATYLYSGPIDNRCRKFCLRIVGKTFKRQDIDKMNNGQLPNTFHSRGGYNCRHVWRPVSGEKVKAEGWKAGQLVDPAYKARIREAMKDDRGQRRTA